MADSTDPVPRAGRRRLARHTKIFFGLIFGLVVGLLVHETAGDAPWVGWVVDNVAYPIGQVFLRLIFMIVVPLVFSSLVLGVLELGDVRKLGRIGGKTLLYTLFASGISVAIGITLVNVFRPGAGVDPSVRAELSSTFAAGSKTAIENAKAYLIDRHGIDASRITTQTDLTDTAHRGQAVIVVTFNP